MYWKESWRDTETQKESERKEKALKKKEAAVD